MLKSSKTWPLKLKMTILTSDNSKSHQSNFKCLKMFSFLFLALVGKCIAQNDTSQSAMPFDKGIMIENLGVLIPWGIGVADLKKNWKSKV